MIYFQFDTSEIKATIKAIERAKKDLETGMRLFLRKLIVDPDISIEQELITNIQHLVYEGYEPELYQRTYRLLSATRSELKGNTLNVYIDNRFLESGSAYQQIKNLTPAIGEDRDVHAGGNPTGGKTYAERVERGYVYNNEGTSFVMPSRPFAEKTYLEIKRKLMSGELKIDEILKPVLMNWSR